MRDVSRAEKWLSRIALVNRPAMAWHEAGNNADTSPDGNALGFRFELGPKSVITRPSGGQRLPGRGLRDYRSGVDRRRRRAER
jgi:sulfane dehydrogenase subunit SoxC